MAFRMGNPQHAIELQALKHYSTIEISQEGLENESMKSRRLWTSSWLSKPALYIYIVTFTISWICLISVWISAKTQHGLPLVISSNHYAWTYGPTAILVIFVNLWRQVDYYCKVLQPWSAMSTGSFKPSKSILLDYVSPFQIVSIVRAFRNRHWPVVLSILGFVILKLIVLSSTALLFVTPVELERNLTVTFLEEFNGSTVWSNADTSVIYTTSNSYWSSISNISSDPVLAYQKILEGKLLQPPNTQADLAYQSFELSDTDTNVQKVTASVDVFVPVVTCEIGNAVADGYLTTGNTTSLQEERSELTTLMAISSPTCPQKSINASAEIKATFCVGKDCPPWILSYGISRVGCSDLVPKNRSTSWKNADIYDFRFAITMANISSDPHKFNFSAPHLQEATAVVCKIDYAMRQTTLTHDLENSQFLLSGELGPSRGHLDRFTQLQFAELVFASLSSTPTVDAFWGEKGVATFQQELGATDALFSLMLLVSGLPVEEKYVQLFMKPEKMAQFAEIALRGVAIQFAQQNLLQPVNANKEALTVGIYLEDRLRLRMSSLWIMVSGFAIMTAIAVGLLMVSHRQVVPQNPTSLAFHAAVLSASPDLSRMLNNCGHMTIKQLRAIVQNCSFRISADEHSFSIIPSSINKFQSTSIVSQTTQQRWIPLAARIPVIGTMLVVPVFIIALLEVLSVISKKRNGLVSVDKAGYAVSVAVYSTTLLCLFIATLFNNFEFTASTFAPYNALRSGLQPAKSNALNHPLGKPAPIALWQMIRNRQVGMALSVSAAVVGSVLAIVASGLWIIDRSTQFQLDVQGSPTSTWDILWSNSSQNDNGAADLLNNIHRNMSLKSIGVWDDLALPDLQIKVNGTISYPKESLLRNNLNFTFIVPTLRAELACEAVPVENLFVTYTSGNPNITHQATWIFTALVDAPSSCFKNYAGRPVGMRTSQGGAGRDSTPLSGWRGNLLTIRELSAFDVVVQEPYLQKNFSFPRNREHETSCPSFGIYYGYGGDTERSSSASWNDGSVATNLSAFVCYQRLQEIETKLVYTASATTTSLAGHKPLSVEVDNSQVRLLRNLTANSDTFSYNVLPHFDTLTPFLDKFTETSGGYKNYNIDPFFNHLFHTRPDLSWEKLFGVENAPVLIEAVTAFYREYMVNVIDLNFRRSHSVSDISAETIVGGSATGFVARLKINAASKLALQIMLSVMSIFGIIAFWSIDLRKTLPRDPCSIGSTMALFANSKVCSREYMPEGAERMSSKDLNRLWQGQRFSLGWWHVSEGETKALAYKTGDFRDVACNSQADLTFKPQKRQSGTSDSLAASDAQHQRLLVEWQHRSAVAISQVTSESQITSVVKRKPVPKSTAKSCPNPAVRMSEVNEILGQEGMRSLERRFGIDIDVSVSTGVAKNAK